MVATDDYYSVVFQKEIKELIEFLSLPKRAFLFGAGCSKCAGLPLMVDLTDAVRDNIPKENSAKAILEGVISDFDATESCTIEDYMSELIDQVSIAERRESRSTKEIKVPVGNKTYTVDQLRNSLVEIKSCIKKEISQRTMETVHHQRFIRAVHQHLQAGKSGGIPPVDYFTLNYDTLVEDAVSLERIAIADGFRGGATGWWSADAYPETDIGARVFKLHGSIDWCLLEGDVLPRRVRKELNSSDTLEPVLIWPAATKYREAQSDPFALIIDKMRQSLRPPPLMEIVLAVVGYSFGDRHINFEIDKAIRESAGRLTVLAFTNDNEPKGQLLEWLNDPVTREHVRIHANRGFFHADNVKPSETDVPWWKFEVLARILEGGI